MTKTHFSQENTTNFIEQANALDKGRSIPDDSLDIIFCDPPSFKNLNDRMINNWVNEADFLKWFRLFSTLSSTKLKKTGIFFLIGDIEEINQLIPILNEFGFQIAMTYYFLKSKKIYTGKRSKDSSKTQRIVDIVIVLTRDFQKKIKKLLKEEQEKSNKSAREINFELSGNANGGGYWSLYCGDNSKNQIPTEEHWNKLREILNISINYEDIISQFKPWEGTNLWDDINYEDDKFLNGTNRPTVLYERLINLNKKNFTDLVVWDPFCGYGNSTLIFKKYGIKFYANEFDMKIHCKAMINTGTSINISKPIGCIN